MASFEEAWAIAFRQKAQADAARLRPLLREVYFLIVRRPCELPKLKRALEDLLSFLASPEGRTDANVWLTDLFFCSADGWESDWDHLPDDFIDILSDMGGALHDTVGHPEIAANLESLPEQLLERVREVEVPTSNSGCS